MHTLKLKKGESVNEHIKAMSEIFGALAAISDAVTEEDRVVNLLATQLTNVIQCTGDCTSRTCQGGTL